MSTPIPVDPESLVRRSQTLMSHAWVVRAFVRHSAEIDDFPELGEIGRAVFDLSRALETRVQDPVGYFKMLAKKLSKFRKAVAQFAVDAPQASAHTNFVQAIVSIQACADGLTELLEQARPLLSTVPSSETDELDDDASISAE